MVTFTCFLVLSLYLISHVYANEEPTSEAVKWLIAGRSVLVHLATPDLNLWSRRFQIATDCPGAFIFNFTLTPDNRTVLLNDEPILPRAHPHTPQPLSAYQTGESATAFAQQIRTDYKGVTVMDLDYYIKSPDTTSGRTSVYNSKYNPRLRIDVLRASMPTHPGYSTPLSSNSQDEIWIWLEDLSAHPPGTLYSSIPLGIKRVQVARRWLENNGTPTIYKTRESLKTCHIWSWLCADTDAYPHYEYIYQENFDQYGKKGSMRHFLATRWGNFVGLVGFGHAILSLAVCGSMVLLKVIRAVFRGVKSVVEVYRKRVEDVDKWVADEDVEGLLRLDRYIEDFGEVEIKDVAEGKGGKKTSVEESLSPPPPYIPMKTEKSSAS